jgi:7-cyano-7-deazaguanine synthase
MKHAIVLLSGGLDSSTTLAIARASGFACYALSFDYGQRHHVELDAARRVAQALGATEHRIAHIDQDTFRGSALTDDLEVPKGRSEKEMGAGIPVTYVPCRNLLFLSYAAAWAEVLGTAHVFIGVNALDYSGYPDCRPEFIAGFERLARIGTKAGLEGACFSVHAPLLQMTKAQIIHKALELEVDLSLTHSCYDPSRDGRACGLCDSCQLRRKGFREAGLEDPIAYAT